jgi:predicted O-methyltransferase YrrM
MKRLLDSYGQRLLRRFGFELVRFPRQYKDLDEVSQTIYRSVADYTMTSSQRVYALVDAVRYIARHRVPGDLVECGVWKGGSSMAMALALKKLGDVGREIYLYDTFEGMSSPTQLDVTIGGELPQRELTRKEVVRVAPEQLASPLEEVRRNVLSTGYPEERIRFVRGKVEETIPDCVPGQIALLRLDTDWYESTRHELIHLFPRLSVGGVLIIDDYGYWQGARKAVDEYLQENNIRILLNRIDHAGRIAVKTA